MRKVYVANNPTFLTVVAAAIRDDAGRLLLQRRPEHKHHGGRWEFPGGKVEFEEIPRLALCREVLEELSLTLDPEALEPAGFAEEPPHDGRPGLVLLLYTSPVWTGKPEGQEGQEWSWFSPGDASRLDMPPMDRALLARLTFNSR